MQTAIRQSAQTRIFSAFGVRIRFLIKASETGGTWSLMHYTAPAGFGSPQWHNAGDETVHVVSGTLNVRIGDEIVQVKPGGTAFIARGALHAFSNSSSDPVVFLALLSSRKQTEVHQRTTCTRRTRSAPTAA
jgi:quercetin dioxygenase-like cupin family protein